MENKTSRPVSRCFQSAASDKKEKLRVSQRKPAPDQVRFTECVAIVTDSELQLPLFVKWAGVTPLSLV